MKHLDEGTLQAWLDMPRSGLDPSEVAEIGDHLAACASCSAALEALTSSDQRAHQLLAGGLDRDVERPPFEDIVARAEGHRAGGRGPDHGRARLQRMAWVASIALAIGVGWMTNELYRGAPPSPALRAPAPGLPAATSAPAADAAAEATRSSPAESAEREAVPPTTPSGGRTDEAERRMETVSGAVAPTGPSTSEPTPPSIVADADVAAARRARQENALEPEVAGAAADAVGAAASSNGFADSVVDDAVTGAQLSAAAGGGVIVRGVVRDADGDPVPSAQVYVGGTSAGALSQEDGAYTLLVPSDGTDSMRLELTVSRLGYRTETLELGVGSGDSAVADFSLEAVPVRLEEVVSGVDVSSLEWSVSTRAEAEAELGAALRTVPGLEIVAVERAVDDRSGAVLVRVGQRLGNGSLLSLVEALQAVDGRSSSVPGDGPAQSRQMGNLVITGTAPVSADSLAALLESLR